MQFDVRTLSAEMVISHMLVDGRDEADARRQVEARGLVVSAIQPVRAGLRAGKGRGLSLVLFTHCRVFAASSNWCTTSSWSSTER